MVTENIGTKPGYARSLKLAGALIPSIFYVNGAPNTAIVGNAGSDIAIDGANGLLYMCKSGTTLTTWYNIGSTT